MDQISSWILVTCTVNRLEGLPGSLRLCKTANDIGIQHEVPDHFVCGSALLCCSLHWRSATLPAPSCWRQAAACCDTRPQPRDRESSGGLPHTEVRLHERCCCKLLQGSAEVLSRRHCWRPSGISMQYWSRRLHMARYLSFADLVGLPTGTKTRHAIAAAA